MQDGPCLPRFPDKDTSLDTPRPVEALPILNGHAPPRPAAEADLTTIKRVALLVAVVVFLVACRMGQAVLMPVTLALLLSLLLSPLVSLVERLTRLPRAVGSAVVIVALLGVLLGGAAQLLQPAQRWVAGAPAQMERIEQRFGSLREPIRQAQEAGRTIDDITQGSEEDTVVTTRMGSLSSMVHSTPRMLGTIGAVVLLVYFFLSSGNRFLRRMVEVAPRLADKRVVVSIARDVQEEMSRYLVMVSLINLALGAATAAALWWMGVANPLLWGAVAFLLNFVPYVGPLFTILVLALVGFSTFDSLGKALMVPGVFFVLTALEGQLLTPTIIGRRLSLDPTAVFVWLLLWGWLWGIVGILLAAPLLACFCIVCRHVDSLQAVGVLISDGNGYARDAAAPAAAVAVDPDAAG